jgi:hypothetical protein
MERMAMGRNLGIVPVITRGHYTKISEREKEKAK